MNERTTFLLGINKVKRTVRDKVKRDGDIVYGGKALNKQVIGVSRIPTVDYDVYTTASPRRRAHELDNKLDKEFGGDVFDVRPAVHPGTHKVFHRKTNVTVADYSRKPKGRLPVRVIGGIKYLALGTIKKRREAILRDKRQEFRHHKDRTAVNRIKISNTLKRFFKK